MEYDVVIVGSGVVGAILAKELTRVGHRVLVLECGQGIGEDWHHTGTEEAWRSFWRKYWDLYTTWDGEFKRAMAKVPNSAYPDNQNAPQPSVLNLRDGYYKQVGPLTFGSNYNRTPGGTTLHWLGTCLRMLPNDFHTQTTHGRGRDWPIGYDDLILDYNRAEREMGVSANVEDQAFLTDNFGMRYSDGYVYPMHRIPQSYLDQYLAARLNGTRVHVDGSTYPVEVISTPQGRNSMPNAQYDGGQGFTPQGAVGYDELGQRCAGNASCIPICPIQAKYNALKTLSTCTPGNLDFKTRAVVTEVVPDPETGCIREVRYKRYVSGATTEHQDVSVSGKVVVLAAHAIENAKILLASGVANKSDQVGRNLMDHPIELVWSQMPDPIGSFRGPGSTSGIPTMRDGAFRKDRAAFRIGIGNWGWNWATDAPFSDVSSLVDDEGLLGADLRASLQKQTAGQMRLDFLVEQLPVATNRVTIDPKYRDPLGQFRPVLHYDIDDYTRAGFKAAREVTRQVHSTLNAKSGTKILPDMRTFEYEGVTYQPQGAGHLAGTHLMGAESSTSVVDSYQRSWDHKNLFLAGCGSMPNMGTSNPTLTIAALAFRTADEIERELAG